MARYKVLASILALLSTGVIAQAPPCAACGVTNVNVLHDGTPTGETRQVNGVDTYIAWPATKKADNAILYLSDVFGIKLAQNKLLADSFAKAGYLVVEPDYFRGDPAPADLVTPGFNMISWRAKHPTSDIDSIIESTIKYMRGTLGVKKIGSVGYCFGGKYVVRFLAKGKGVDAGFIAHPSLLEPPEWQALAAPLSIGAAETDTAFPAPKRHEAEVTLQKLGLPYQINLYGSVNHGFAVRANISDKRQKYAKEEAYLQAVRFFDAWLKQ